MGVALVQPEVAAAIGVGIHIVNGAQSLGMLGSSAVIDGTGPVPHVDSHSLLMAASHTAIDSLSYQSTDQNHGGNGSYVAHVDDQAPLTFDTASFRIDGRQLFEDTVSEGVLITQVWDSGNASGDVLSNVDFPTWRANSITRNYWSTLVTNCPSESVNFCSNWAQEGDGPWNHAWAAETWHDHPVTKIIFRIHRVKPTESTGTPGGMATEVMPGWIDAFGIDASGALHRDGLSNPGGTGALGGASIARNLPAPTLPSRTIYVTETTPKGTIHVPVGWAGLSANANIAALPFAGKNPANVTAPATERLFAIDSGGVMETTFQSRTDAAAPEWSATGWYALYPPSAISSFVSCAPIAAVEPFDSDSDRCVCASVATNGSIVTATDDANAADISFTRAMPPGTVKPWDPTAQSGGGIAAVSPAPGIYDVFYADSTGAVQFLNYWYSTSGNNWIGSYVGQPTGLVGGPGGQAVAIRRAAYSIDVFTVDSYGQIITATFTQSPSNIYGGNGTWSAPQYVTFDNRVKTQTSTTGTFYSAVPGGFLTAVARRGNSPLGMGGAQQIGQPGTSDRIDVFTVGYPLNGVSTLGPIIHASSAADSADAGGWMASY
jgi:hypothetical protein